jgi:hypothetical protein
VLDVVAVAASSEAMRATRIVGASRVVIMMSSERDG